MQMKWRRNPKSFTNKISLNLLVSGTAHRNFNSGLVLLSFPACGRPSIFVSLEILKSVCGDTLVS